MENKDEKKEVRLLSDGFQSFEEIRNEHRVYVDKTDMVWKIANTKKYNFLSRPRRFGKSLLTDTLKCYFEARTDLFQGLKIMEMEKEEDWVKRAVFQFDFSGCETAAALESYLSGTLSEYENIYGKENTHETAKDRFLALMKKAYTKTGQQVAVLVDEYDSPLQHTLTKEEEHEKLVTVYRSFFPVMKTGSNLIKCLFITGITKFTQLSLFSMLNTMSILSSNSDYATVCGITEQELIDNYMPEIEALGEKNGWTVEQTLQELRNMYDGYCFSSNLSKSVYNPFSLISALADKNLGYYWTSSGASAMLNDILIQSDEDGEGLEGRVMNQEDIDTSDVNIESPTLFLYQSGYLTIKDYSPGVYILGIPNNEVRRALFNIVLPNAVRKRRSVVDNEIARMRLALNKRDIVDMMEHLKLIILQTPYPTQKGEHIYEERFQFFVKGALLLCGCYVLGENHIATGRPDLVARYGNTTMVFELKLDNNGGLEAAKQQLADRNYTAAYLQEGSDVYAIAVSFSTDDSIRGISGYDIKKMSIS